ncbi:hypothetical protein BV22DRAFT_158712 [Leucogyrophana mollusca]|uniref:Uncharacterized protein n=1 Tax=Leucogyrophana mollusca TaxID=85980 RepID=A0ACB8BU33_9AGAM|nr:hypothetical protein BV22DRAFT_158712 [Leucogyrophana mollusca]
MRPSTAISSRVCLASVRMSAVIVYMAPWCVGSGGGGWCSNIPSQHRYTPYLCEGRTRPLPISTWRFYPSPPG